MMNVGDRVKVSHPYGVAFFATVRCIWLRHVMIRYNGESVILRRDEYTFQVVEKRPRPWHWS